MTPQGNGPSQTRELYSENRYSALFIKKNLQFLQDPNSQIF